MERVSILGLPVDLMTMSETLHRIQEILDGPPCGRQMLTANAEMVVAAQHDAQLSHIWQEAAYVVADGYGLVWAASRMGYPLPERIAGVELVGEICRLSAEEGYRLYFLGAKPGVAEEARARLLLKYPKARIVGTHHGYFTPKETKSIVDDIHNKGTDVLFAALGAPQQEKWIYANRLTTGIRLGIGVGGSFDVWAGRVSRAPKWMREHGLEWLYRLCQQPKRLPRMRSLPIFVWMVQRAERAQVAQDMAAATGDDPSPETGIKNRSKQG